MTENHLDCGQLECPRKFKETFSLRWREVQGYLPPPFLISLVKLLRQYVSCILKLSMVAFVIEVMAAGNLAICI